MGTVKSRIARGICQLQKMLASDDRTISTRSRGIARKPNKFCYSIARPSTTKIQTSPKPSLSPKADAELNTWFQQHCAFQNAASSAFNDIPVPEGLKEQILSERKAHLTLTSRRRALVAACAVVVIAFCGVLSFRTIFPPKPSLDFSFGNFHTNMIGVIIRYPVMDITTNNVQAIRSYLAQHGQSNLVSTPAVDKIVQTVQRLMSLEPAAKCWTGKTNQSP